MGRMKRLLNSVSVPNNRGLTKLTIQKSRKIRKNHFNEVRMNSRISSNSTVCINLKWWNEKSPKNIFELLNGSATLLLKFIIPNFGNLVFAIPFGCDSLHKFTSAEINLEKTYPLTPKNYK